MSARAKAAVLTLTAGTALVFSVNPASASQSDWISGLGSNYSHVRTVAPGAGGAAVYARIYWNGTRVGLNIETTDTKRDGKGAVAYLFYEVKIKGKWLSTGHPLAHASGGFGSKGYAKIHSRYPTRAVTISSCTAKNGNTSNCTKPA